MKKKEIIIVDDHMLFADGLSKLVNSLSEYYCDKIFKNGQELVDYLSDNVQMPDIILLDVKMPVMDGLATMKWIQENKPDLKVLVLSMENNEEIIIKMIKYGAGGYLLKDINPLDLKKALDIIDEQGYFYTEMITKLLIDRLDNDNQSIAHDFKENELKLIQLACSEKTFSEIAEEMCLSPKTIEGYRQVVYQKMGVKSRVGMVLYAIKNGLVKV
jgi:DNA-binding NarL/FixJ family response regulator